MNNINAVALPRQTNTSETIRVSIKRLASNNGGLARFMRGLGIPYNKTWERVNRNKGDLIDLVVELARNGLDEPLRIAADASGLDVTPKVQFLRKACSVRPIRSHALDLHHATTDVTRIVEEALADKMIDDKERERVKSAIHYLRKKMAELEGRISGDTP